MTGGGEGLTETSRVGVDAFSGRSVVSGQEFRLSVNHNRVIQLCILMLFVDALWSRQYKEIGLSANHDRVM